MKKKSKIFTVVVGDLVQSRTKSDRQQLSRKIHWAINHLSKRFQKELYAPFTLTRGIDELSGVLKQPAKSYLICRLINEEVHPQLFRFAIARGSLDVAVSSKDAGRMDGYAFHVASNLIQHAKKNKLYYLFSLRSKYPELDALLNESVNLIYTLSKKWSVHQRRVVQLYKKFNRQKRVAKELNITQQAVSDALQQANWKNLHQIETSINRILEEISYK